MNREERVKKLKEFLIDELLVELDADEIKNDMSLERDLDVDSLGFTELMAHLGDTYRITILDSEFIPENFKSIDSIMALLDRKLSTVE